MAVTFTSLDPNITTSEGGVRIVTGISSYRGARASMGRVAADGLAAGKYYYEARINVIGGFEFVSIGLSKTGTTLSTIDIGYQVSNNHIQRLSPVQNVVASWSKAVANDIIGIGFDLADGTIIVSKNGVVSATTCGATGTGTYYPNVVLQNTGDDVTANFGATPFNSIPDGYSAWDTIPRLALPPVRSVGNQRPINFIRL